LTPIRPRGEINRLPTCPERDNSREIRGMSSLKKRNHNTLELPHRSKQEKKRKQPVQVKVRGEEKQGRGDNKKALTLQTTKGKNKLLNHHIRRRRNTSRSVPFPLTREQLGMRFRERSSIPGGAKTESMFSGRRHYNEGPPSRDSTEGGGASRYGHGKTRSPNTRPFGKEETQVSVGKKKTRIVIEPEQGGQAVKD